MKPAKKQKQNCIPFWSVSISSFSICSVFNSFARQLHTLLVNLESVVQSNLCVECVLGYVLNVWKLRGSAQDTCQLLDKQKGLASATYVAHFVHLDHLISEVIPTSKANKHLSNSEE